MSDQLVINLFIKPFLTFLRDSIKNKKKKKAFDKYLIDGRDLLLEWYPVEEE